MEFMEISLDNSNAGFGLSKGLDNPGQSKNGLARKAALFHEPSYKFVTNIAQFPLPLCLIGQFFECFSMGGEGRKE
jgi:hypothetical protein